MAEAALRDALKKQKIRWYTVLSAGLNAAEGAPMSKNSAIALREAGIPFDENFRARPLTEKVKGEALAVVCMTEAQKHTLSGNNVTSFYEIAGREIPDPFGGSVEVYRATLQAILDCMPRIIGELCSDQIE